MNNFDSQRQDPLKRRWQEKILSSTTSSSNFYHNRVITSESNPSPSSIMVAKAIPNHLKRFPAGGFDDDDLVSTVVPAVTVVLEGRSICQRISLHKHASYQSLAKALRQMFVDAVIPSDKEVDLSNAIPGHLIAYEDMENDLLLVGDLNWKDFVRVAKRIRILPSKVNSKRGRGGRV